MFFDVFYIFKENYEKKLSTGYVFFQKIIKFAAIYYGNSTKIIISRHHLV